jgi:hypothetical protein
MLNALKMLVEFTAFSGLMAVILMYMVAFS